MSQKQQQPVPRKKREPHSSPTGRKTRKDRGVPRLTPRDALALTWIGQQYAMRLDHIQAVLGRHPGHGAAHEDQISESSTRSAIARWKKAGWVSTEGGHDKKPMWVWLTKQGLKRVKLPYQYHDLARLTPQDRIHLHAITEIRLRYDTGKQGTAWTSERTMLQGTRRPKGRTLIHRPDAILSFGDMHLAIEVELSRKTPALLSHILVALVRDGEYHGQVYHDLKARVGADAAQACLPDAWHLFTLVCYVAPPSLRKQLRRVRATLVQQGRLSDEEAERILIQWYPLATSEAEIAQERQEDHAPLPPEEDRWMFLDEEREQDN